MALKHYLEQHKTYRERPSKSAATIGGASVDLAEPQTAQALDNSILGANVNGVPRGREAYQAHQLGETWAMEIIKNAINDQLMGGELGMETEDDDEPSPAARSFWELLRDVLAGPHLQDNDWDDLVSAAIADMCDIGHAYWEPIPSADGSIPVAALNPVGALTVRHNVTENGQFDEPAYYQAPLHSMGGANIVSASNSELNQLKRDDLVSMRYPNSNRSDRIYARAPGMQIQAALEHLTHSTIHSTRYYNDNEIPHGFLQIMQADDSTLDDVEESLKNAVGDPRSVEVIGGDGAANWIEMGGTALNLDVIAEQQWFLQLCLAAFGLTKGEIALTEDINYNTADAELTIVYKRVTKPLMETFSKAVTRQVFPKFESYQTLDPNDQFSLRIRNNDPVQERANEAYLRQRYEAGGLTYDEYRQLQGEDPGETTIEIDGQELDYGEHPRWVIEERIRDLRESQDDGDAGDGDQGDDSDE